MSTQPNRRGPAWMLAPARPAHGRSRVTRRHVTAVLLLVAASAAAELPACLPACSGVDLRDTDLRGANLRGAVLIDAILSGAG